MKLLSTSAVRETLALISRKAVDFTLYQTMLFDHGTTEAHQDWIYLDSRPNGHLIAAWIALEDILPEGIRFYVYPGTHHFMPKAIYNAHQEIGELYTRFLDEIEQYLASEKPKMYAPPLRKGDILFWGSRLIHGSTPGTNPSLRRRSIAAHFVPEGFRFGNLERDFTVQFGERYGLRYAQYPLDIEFQNANDQSNTPMIQAFKQAEERANQAEERAKQAEERAKQAEERANQATERQKQAVAQAEKADARANEAREREKQAMAQAERAKARANRARAHVAYLENSRSWRFTAPLRWMRRGRNVPPRH